MEEYTINDRVEISIKDQIAFVMLNRAEKHNALDMPMFLALKKTIIKLKKDREIRAIIVEGRGEDFCSGLDVKSVMKTTSAPFKLLFKWLPWQANLAQFVTTGWKEVAVPVIMVVHGRCWGGGLQIALGGDFRIATPNASLSIMEAKWGLIPDMGSAISIKELAKQDIMKELAMTGQVIDGREGLEYGLVTHLSDKPIDKAIELAELIKLQSPDSVAGVKRLYNKSWWSNSGVVLARESWYQVKILVGKNRSIKTHNELTSPKQRKPFALRQKW